MYSKVLILLDGSDLAERALSHMRSLAEGGSIGEITLLNVFKNELPRNDEYPIHIDISALKEPLFNASVKYLTEVKSRLKVKEVQVNVESVEGVNPNKTIMDYVQKNGIDLIVMATHGYTGLQKLMLGWAGCNVVSRSSIPVLLIPD